MDLKNGQTIILSNGLEKICYENIPKEVIYKAKLLLLDYIGYTLYAYKEEAAEIITNIILQLGGNSESTIIGYGIKTSCLLSALANGAMGHMAELDDTHAVSGTHPGDSIISASLAVGEREGINGKKFLESIISGYEAALRIGEAIAPSHFGRGFHASGTINTFGAAVAVGKILNFNASKIAEALGLAGLQASGFMYYLLEGVRMPKDFNSGRAALSGVLAALLINGGFQGGKTVLESEKGFCKLYSDPFSIKLNRISDRIGKVYKIMEVSHKMYSSCRHIHSATEAILKIMKENKDILPNEIERVIARIMETGAIYVNDAEPWLPNRGTYGSRFSAQFNIAVAILYGEEGIYNLTDRDYVKSMMDSNEIRDVMKKITVLPDHELDKEYPYKWSSIIEVKTKNNFYSSRVDFPKGEPQNPASEKEIINKFKRLTSNIFENNKDKDEVIKLILDMEEVDNIKEIFELLENVRR